MPIYAYKCGSCGHAKDVLQKVSDAPLAICPACGAEAFSKQLTAAGFQLKGSGWYVTDFRGGSGGASATTADGAAASGTSVAAGTGPAAGATKPTEGGTAKSESPTAPAGAAGASH
jgi:putative FmdB family regulatory protein